MFTSGAFRQASNERVTPDILAAGDVRFNIDAVLLNCPAQPALLVQPDDPTQEQTVQLEEAANALGIAK